MKRNKSVKTILETYDSMYGNLNVHAFGEDNKRICSVGGNCPFNALKELTKQLKVGRRVLITTNFLLPHGTPETYEEYFKYCVDLPR